MGILAVNGGKPVIDTGTYQHAPWPRGDKETAEVVKELYLSGKWSGGGAGSRGGAGSFRFKQGKTIASMVSVIYPKRSTKSAVTRRK